MAHDPAPPTARRIRPAVVGVVLLVVAAFLVGGCGDDVADADAPATPAATTDTTSASTTTWVAPADDPTRPSPAAVAADEEFRVAPDGLLDCGVHVRTSGWPTTFHPGIDVLDCILEAAEVGTPAQFVSTARDFEGGMEGAVFRVVGPGEILVIDYRTDPRGAVSSTERTCGTLVAANFPVPECR